MAGAWLTKQADQLTAKFLNDVNDSVAGGAVVSLPAGAPTPLASATQPSDRIVLDTATALALSDTAVGTLFGGVYMYVGTASGATAAPALGLLAFWNTAVADNLYQVTNDESGSQGANLIAGICINAITKGNWGWIQIAGKATIKFRAVLTGPAPANGCGVYAAAAGAGASVATADVFAGSVANPTFTQADTLVQRFLGTAEALPVAGAASAVSLKHMLLYHV